MKTNRTFVSVALLSSLTLAAGVAFSADEYPTNPEKSFTTQSPPAQRSRAEVRAELDEFRAGSVTPDGWQDVGGERGQAMVPHKYAYEGGKFVAKGGPVEDIGGASRTWSADELKMASLNYRNAP